MRDSHDAIVRTSSLATRAQQRTEAAAGHGLPVEVAVCPEAPSKASSWPHLFATSCHQHSNLVALLDAATGEALTYRQLGSRVRRRAAALAALGVGPEVMVAILAPAGIERIVTSLAVLMAGGVYVPLDPQYPTLRWQLILDDTAAPWLICEPSLLAGWTPPPPTRCQEIASLDDHAPTERSSNSVPSGPVPSDPVPFTPSDLSPESAAYVIYTSGSTGRPRGVVIEHRALAWYTATCIDHYELTPSDHLPQLASLSFDISIGEIFPCLAAGATLILPPQGPLDPLSLLEFCRAQGITVLFPATALWHELARHLSSWVQDLPPSLRLISFGGERVSEKLVNIWLDTFGDRLRLVNGYGPTETTVEATLQDVTAAGTAGNADRTGLVSIGLPVAGVKCWVLDGAQRPLSPGQVGELCLSSPGLARGYLNNSATTACRFIPDPFSQTPGKRLYRTGDLVRQLDDGRLEIVGRADRQVKIRGFRVEPGEIEAVLLEHPAVTEAAVVVSGAGTTNPGLVAFVVMSDSGPEHNTLMEAELRPDAATGILGVGSVPGRQHVATVSRQELRHHLKQRLPAHSVPNRVLLLPRLPLNSNHKIDLSQLARQADESLQKRARFAVQDDTVEGRIWRIMSDVLQVDDFSPEDDFFMLGGDSILAIRVVTRAHAAGLRLSAKQIFEQRTVCRLAAVAVQDPSSSGGADHATPGQASKTPEVAISRPLIAPLTPVQRWFFDEAQLANPHHFNQSMLLQVRRLGPSQLRDAVVQLIRRHEVLRLRFRRSGDGWRQHIIDADAIAPSTYFEVFDQRQTPLEADIFCRRLPELWHDWTTSVQSGLDFERGPVARFAFFDFGQDRPSRLLIAIHHLVVDGVTWSVLLQDLESLCGHFAGSVDEVGGTSSDRNSSSPVDEVGGTSSSPQLALPPTTSYLHWAELQDHHAQSPNIVDELPFWLDQCRDIEPLRLDFPQADRLNDNTFESTQTVTLRLDRHTTRRLLRDVPAAYRTQINDVLLCAVTRALTASTPYRRCWIDLEGHGREEIFPDIDLSRTAGWFTSTFPVALQLSPSSAADEVAGEEVTSTPRPSKTYGLDLKAIKEQLRAVPRHGIGFGQLFYLSRRDDVTKWLAPRTEPSRPGEEAMQRPEISFNYLGQLDALFRHSRWLTPADEPRGAERCGHGLRPYVLEIDGGVVNGQLWLNWHSSHNLHHRAHIEELAERCRRELLGLIEHCLDASTGGPTPSDVPLAAVDQGALDHLFDGRRDLEDLYPLTPMQEGMLFHCRLQHPSTLYFEQSSWTLQGPLQTETLRRAWQQQIDTYPALRSFFVWQGLERPLQGVQRRVELPFEIHDLSDLLPQEQRRALEELLRRDRQRGFDLSRPPLSRILLVKLTDDRTRFVWSYHHALLDGWSIARLFAAAFKLYDLLSLNEPPSPNDPPSLEPQRTLEDLTIVRPSMRPAAPPPFRNYIAWLQGMDTDSHQRSAQFWRDYLRGLKNPSLLAQGQKNPRKLAETSRATTHLSLSAEITGQLGALARHAGATLATLIHGAWSLVLARHAGHHDVVFGSTVSCRPTDLEGVEQIVGLMINTLPVRCHVDPRADCVSWMQGLQANLVEIRQHEHSSLAKMQRYSDLPGGEALFDSLLVFENYPADAALDKPQRRGRLVIDDYLGFDETNYTWTLGVLPGPRLRFEANFDATTIGHPFAEQLMNRLQTVLIGLIEEPRRKLGEIPHLSTEERRQIITNGRGPELDLATTSVVQSWREVVQRHPERTAVVDPSTGQALTYRDLALRAQALADRLIDGATDTLHEEPIGILLDRQVDRIVATWAVLLTGATYVPLEPEYPVAHSRRCCRVVGLRKLITHPQIAGRILGLPAEDSSSEGSSSKNLDLAIETLAPDVTYPSDVPVPTSYLPWVEGEQLAYILFTSGTSGQPKAVAVEHRALAWYCQVARTHYALTPEDRVVHMAPVGFDFSICEIFPALTSGATLILAPADASQSARTFFDFCRRQAVTVAFPPTALWHQWVDDVASDPAMLPECLRLLASGGERILDDKLRRWRQAVGNSPQLFSGYGPTETTVEASIVCLTDDAGPPGTELAEIAVDGPFEAQKASPLGRPLPGATIRVLDAALQPCGFYQPGELFIGGPGLARGYWGDPKGTATSFLPDPLAEQAGERLYRTGDLGFADPEGGVFFTGRRDLQLKIRGHRIEPGGIESALVSLPGVRYAAVVGRSDARGGGWLEAVVEIGPSEEDGSAPSAESIRQQLALQLPPFLIPAQLHFVESLPRTPAGKIDRLALQDSPQAIVGSAVQAPGPSLPALPLERRLAALWVEVLTGHGSNDEAVVKNISRDSNFFMLGGHSLMAAQLLQRVRLTFEVEISLRDLFIYPTLGELGNRVQALLDGASP